jgi:hypothetical protein
MNKGEVLRKKIQLYKGNTGYAHFSSEQREAAGKSLNQALRALPNSDNTNIIKEYRQIRKGYDNE